MLLLPRAQAQSLVQDLGSYKSGGMPKQTNKRNEVLISTTTWMNFGNMLSGGSQSQKVKMCDSIYMKCPE